MSDPAEPRRKEPVFRLVSDTTALSQALRFILSRDNGFIEPFVVPPPDAWSEN